jgi:hypothetical protein
MTLEHFGNPLLEQRKLAEGKAFVERSDQVVLTITGEDRASWLHALVSQDILNLKVGDSTEALLLNPQGHIEHQLKVIVGQQELMTITASERAAALLDWLNKMRFRSKVEVAKTDFKVFGTFVRPSGPCWIDGFSQEPKSSVSYAKERASFSYFEQVGEAPPALEQAGLMAYQALRIAAGRPEISDVDERSLPHEFDWLASAVHLSKGCYRGQESVAKVHNLGHPPRRLAILHLEQGEALCAKGDEVYYQDKKVGSVLAGALHYELGSLALVLLNRNTPYLDLDVHSGESVNRASQQVLVPADAGKAANLPRPSAFKLTGK